MLPIKICDGGMHREVQRLSMIDHGSLRKRANPPIRGMTGYGMPRARPSQWGAPGCRRKDNRRRFVPRARTSEMDDSNVRSTPETGNIKRDQILLLWPPADSRSAANIGTGANHRSLTTITVIG